jgi:hypothetical protein
MGESSSSESSYESESEKEESSDWNWRDIKVKEDTIAKPIDIKSMNSKFKHARFKEAKL